MSNMPTIKIAITSNIGCGKSSVSNILRDKGYLVYDTDLISKKLSLSNGDAYPLLVNAFPTMLNDNLEIDSKRLANLCFNNKTELNKLESILHPLILKEMLSLMNNSSNNNCSNLVFCEVPLLYEASWDIYFDDVWLITSSKDIIIKRLQDNRHMSLKEIEQRLKAQMPLATKLLKNNKVINNEGNKKQLCEQVETMLHLY